jgi:hypothetical protein
MFSFLIHRYDHKNTNNGFFESIIIREFVAKALAVIVNVK